MVRDGLFGVDLWRRQSRCYHSSSRLTSRSLIQWAQMERLNVERHIRKSTGGLVDPRSNPFRQILVVCLYTSFRRGGRGGKVEVESMNEEKGEEEGEDGKGHEACEE